MDPTNQEGMPAGTVRRVGNRVAERSLHDSSLRAVRVARPLCSALCGRAIEAARILLLMDDEAGLIQDNGPNLSRAYAGGCFVCDRQVLAP